MRQRPILKCRAMVKSALVVAILAGGVTMMAAGATYADGKLVLTANAAAKTAGVQVLRGEPGAVIPAWTEEEVPAVSPYAVVGAGDGWLLDRRTGRIISCYRIGTGYVGERAIRCISGKVSSVTY